MQNAGDVGVEDAGRSQFIQAKNRKDRQRHVRPQHLQKLRIRVLSEKNVVDSIQILDSLYLARVAGRVITVRKLANVDTANDTAYKTLRSCRGGLKVARMP